jgi:Heterokaryon incompatibility protein Het-C
VQKIPVTTSLTTGYPTLPLSLIHDAMALRTRLSPLTILLVTVLVIAVFSVETYAFGAGNIPSYGFLEGKAFRVDLPLFRIPCSSLSVFLLLPCPPLCPCGRALSADY